MCMFFVEGPGKGITLGEYGTGGSHGGEGGSEGIDIDTQSYGSFTNPQHYGSGGGMAPNLHNAIIGKHFYIHIQ